MAREYLTKAVIPPHGITESEFLFIEDFEGTFDWITGGDSTNRIVAKAPEAALRGNFGLLIDTGDAIDAHVAYADKKFWLKSSPKVLMEAQFKAPAGITALGVIAAVGLITEDGNYIAGYAVKVNLADGDICIYDQSDAWVSIGNLGPLTANSWYSVEIEADVKNTKYSKIRMRNKELDASTKTPLKGPLDINTNYVTLEAKNVGAYQAKVYFDNIIVRALPR